MGCMVCWSGEIEHRVQDAAITARLEVVISACQLLTNLLQPGEEFDINVH